MMLFIDEMDEDAPQYLDGEMQVLDQFAKDHSQHFSNAVILFITREDIAAVRELVTLGVLQYPQPPIPCDYGQIYAKLTTNGVEELRRLIGDNDLPLRLRRRVLTE